MQFKNEEVGNCGKLFGVRGSVLFAESKGEKRQYQPWKMEVNIGVLPSSVDYKIRFSICCCVVIRFQHWITSYCLA